MVLHNRPPQLPAFGGGKGEQAPIALEGAKGKGGPELTRDGIRQGARDGVSLLTRDGF